MRLARVGAALASTLLLATVVGKYGGETSTPEPSAGLQAIVDSVIKSGPGRDDNNYTEPTIIEAASIAAAVTEVRNGLRPQLPTGYTVTDIGGFKILAEATDAGPTRGWGMAAIRPSSRSKVVIEVPHPVADQRTEAIGVQLAEESDSAALLVAGAHRTVANGKADVAHNPNSAFAAMDAALVGEGWKIIQLHGFSEEKHTTAGSDEYANVDVVLSNSTPSPSRFLLDIDARLRAQGFTTCVYYGRWCDELSGSTNVQAAHAKTVGADFIHVEISESVRSNRRSIDRLIGALADVMDVAVA